jgi:hypothetical protein
MVRTSLSAAALGASNSPASASTARSTTCGGRDDGEGRGGGVSATRRQGGARAIAFAPHRVADGAAAARRAAGRGHADAKGDVLDGEIAPCGHRDPRRRRLRHDGVEKERRCASSPLRPPQTLLCRRRTRVQTRRPQQGVHPPPSPAAPPCLSEGSVGQGGPLPSTPLLPQNSAPRSRAADQTRPTPPAGGCGRAKGGTHTRIHRERAPHRARTRTHCPRSRSRSRTHSRPTLSRTQLRQDGTSRVDLTGQLTRTPRKASFSKTAQDGDTDLAQ